MKTVAVTIPLAMSARNLLRSDFLEILRSKTRVLILSTLAHDPAFREEFSRENVFIEPLDFESPLWARVVRRFSLPVEAQLFTQRTQIETLLFYRDWLKAENPWKYRKTLAMTAILGREPLLSPLRRLHYAALYGPRCAALLKRYQVDALFLTHLFHLPDQQAAVTAIHSGIPVFGMPHSWDNLTSKSGVRMGSNPDPGVAIPFRFKKLIVWGPVMKQELMQYYGYREDDISIAGIPQFDIYAHKEKLMPREDYCRKIGMDPAKKMIVYAAGSPKYMAEQNRLIEIMAEIIKSGRLRRPSQLIVRHHPNKIAIDSLKKSVELFHGKKDIFFITPSAAYTALPGVAWTRERDPYELANLLHAADVVITMASTMNLDAAAMDKPVININFSGGEEKQGFALKDKMERYTHYKKIADTGAFTNANNAQDIERELNRYLENPSLESNLRKKVIEMEGGVLDGGAGKRIARYLLDFI